MNRIRKAVAAAAVVCALSATGVGSASANSQLPNLPLNCAWNNTYWPDPVAGWCVIDREVWWFGLDGSYGQGWG
jgi:hypothetical protein